MERCKKNGMIYLLYQYSLLWLELSVASCFCLCSSVEPAAVYVAWCPACIYFMYILSLRLRTQQILFLKFLLKNQKSKNPTPLYYYTLLWYSTYKYYFCPTTPLWTRTYKNCSSAILRYQCKLFLTLCVSSLSFFAFAAIAKNCI